MWPRRVITGLSCSARSTANKVRTQPLSSKTRNPSSRSPPLRQSPSEAIGPETYEERPPLVLRSSTEVHYSSTTSKKSGGKDKMKQQSIQIPGLTLLNNLAPHAIAPTSEGSLISPTAPQPPAKAPYVPPRKLKENKKAKARRALAEAQAQAALDHMAQHPTPTPAAAPVSGQHGAYNFNNFDFNNANFMNLPPNNFHNSNNFIARPPPTRSRFPPKNLPQDGRVAPSKASGGIPDPTPLYIAQSLPLPSSLRNPRRILVIMDLNGTLLYRPNKRNPFNFIQRPHARQFLDYCVDTFHVAIWSSARPENVDKMVSQLLSPQQRAKCLVIWGRDKFGLSPADYSARVQCYKRLSSIWNDPTVAASHPAAAQGQRWDQTNTVLVDDSAEKGRSEPYNILQLPEFEGLSNEPPNVLPQVHDYLNTLCYQTNISSYIRDRPFTIDSSYRLPPPPDFHAA
ncbi:HAD-like domain-containing protein [Trichoderma sp. SZMC 28013]